jgi:RNA polymerase sigma-70 factor (ECF subfamily)
VRCGEGERWEADPAAVVDRRESVRLACVVALRVLPPRQRAVFVLCALLRVRASEAAAAMDTSTSSVNSLLQRARSALNAANADPDAVDPVLDAERNELLSRYVCAITTGNVDALVALALEELGTVPAAAPSLLAA